MSNYILVTLSIMAVFVLIMAGITIFLYRRIAGWSEGNAKRSESDTYGEKKEIEEIYRGETFGRDEIGELVKSFDSMEKTLGRQMKNISYMTAEREKAQAELDVATRIQKDMLPSDFSAVSKDRMCDIFGSMTPAKEVGGDFYDFFPLDEDRICIVIADVSGKGVPAALFMTISKVLIKQRAMGAGSPAQILADVNDQLCADNKEMLFVTVWLGIVNTKTGDVEYCNAGHEYPVLLHDGKSSLMKEGVKNDPPLALAAGFRFTDRKMQLKKGDGLFVYTDGVPEAKSMENGRYGMERMLRILEECEKDASCQNVIEALENDMDSFVDNKDPFDDVTMLMIRINGTES